jgi:hypothetical protein
MPKPMIVRNELGDGLSSLVVYGVSADVSDAARRLSTRVDELLREEEPVPHDEPAQPAFRRRSR